MEKIIKKAIEGGYMPCEFCTKEDCDFKTNGGKGSTEYAWFNNAEGEGCGYPVSQIVLDSFFWQALGKACGWEELQWKTKAISVNHFFYEPYKPLWNYYYYKFHSINLTEGWEAAIKYLEGIIN